MFQTCIDFMKNNIISIVLLMVVAIYIWYERFREKNVCNTTRKEGHIVKQIEPFINSNKFVGEKKGYVFKNDFEGLGYYLDSH
jgi:hypothetical protein